MFLHVVQSTISSKFIWFWCSCERVLDKYDSRKEDGLIVHDNDREEEIIKFLMDEVRLYTYEVSEIYLDFVKENKRV